MQVEIGGLGFLRRPGGVSVPAVGAALEGGCLPGGLLALAVEIVAEEWRLNVFAEFARGLVAAEGNLPDAIAFVGLPLAVKPRAGDHEVGVIGIALGGVVEDLPRSPGVFLIPEASDVQVGHGGGMQLVDPGFLLPE